VILYIYKPKTWTSFDVVAKLRGVLKTKKIGHAGTLDPLAEGVLIVLTGEDTKKQDELMHQEKEYETDVVFGLKSVTYDLEGPVEVSQDFVNDVSLVETKVSDLLKNYIGEYEQTIPAFSAKKKDGKKLYDLARKGKIELADLPVKKVNVKSISIVKSFLYEFNEQKFPTLTLNIVCDSGFYVRALANDLGRDLGYGALASRILRCRVGSYSVKEAISLNDFIQKQTFNT
jgi:tRNA pseudouridine55 synthase